MSGRYTALVVGLGGVTNGGKTTICQSLERFFSSTKSQLRVQTIHLDDHYRSPDDPNHVHLPEFNHHDWDSLHALNVDQFLADIERERVNCDLLLVEGFLIFNIPLAKDLFHLIYYFDLPYEECLRRRSEIIYDPPNPQGYFQGHVWPAYLNAREETSELYKNKRIIVVNTAEQSFENVQENIVKEIEKILLEK